MSTSYKSKIVTNGLLAYYDAQNPKSYLSSGNTWLDLIQPNYNAVLDGPSFNTNRFYFDGINDTCRTTLPVSTLGEIFTVCVWFTLDSIASSDTTSISKRLISADQSVGGTKWCLGTTPTRELRFGGSGGNERISNVILNLSEIYFATVTHNSTTYSLFLNGINRVRNDTSTIATSSAGNVSIGSRPSTLDRLWTGSVFSASFYNRILSDEEILANYNSMKSRYGHQ